LGKDHLDTANSLINLGELLVRTKKYDEAMSLHRRCLAIRETRLGNDHRDTLTVLNNIACIHDEQKQHDEAIRLHQRVLTTVETTLGKDHDDVARMTHNLARALLNVRRYDEAEQLLLRSIALIESRRGRDHPDVTHGLGMLADLHFATDRAGEGRRLYDRLLRSRHRDVTTLLPAMSQSQQHAYLETRVSPLWRSALSAGYWHGRSDSAMAELSAAWVANGKGMQQEALAVTTQLQSLDDPQARAVSEQLRGVRQMLTKVKAEPVRPGLEAESRKELDRLEQRERDFATQLLKLSGRTGRGRGWADIDSIRKSLPDGGVLIDFAFLLLHDFKRADSSSVLFVAWVTPQRGAARVVDLGPAAEIVALSHALQAELAKSAATIRDKGEIEAEKALRPLLQAMAKRLLDPLMALDEVKNARQWVICPDGNLWAVPWAALTLSDGKYAVERYPIRLVNAGRDLVVSADQASTMETSAPLIVSDPDFDLGRDDAATKTREIVGGVDPNQSRNLVSRNLRLGNVKRLPNTAIEAESITPRIAELLKQPPRTFFGDQALEAVVKSAKRPKMLVLSTHGFFLPEQEIRERGPEARGAHDSSTGPLLTKSGDVFEDPLLRCGLLLAACNDQPKPGQVRPGDDGILTGLEVLGLDLRGCELVVLSACETGVSNVRFGEGVGVIGQVGVAGLRQAFQLAGAEAVLASLWQVPDRETALLMIGFFDQLAAGADRPTALAESQRAIIKRRRERSAAAHPFFWAAFTLTGRDIGTLATLKTAHDYNERGRKFLASRADALALADFDAALKLDPKFARAYHNRGVALKNSNKIDEALDSFNKAIELDSNNAAVYRDRSLVYRDRKRYAEALADLDKAVPLDDEVEALIDRAYVHRLMKNFELAKADAAAALKKAPNVWRAWMEKGIQAEFHEKKPDDAIAAYTKSIELNPRASAAYYRRGLVHLSRNAGDKSLKDFEAAVTITPNYLAAREELAKLKSRQGDSRGAVVEWREVIRLAPKSANARWGLGNDLRIAGQVAESIQQMDEALKLNPSYPDAFAHRGVARRLLGQLTEAEADLKKAIELYPKYAWAFNELGTVHLAQKRADDAIGAFDKAIELVPKYVAALRSRAASHRLKGDEVAAKADENRALEAEHGSLAPLQTAAAYIERGRRFLNNRAYELALTDFDAAIKLDANSAVAHYNRGLALDNRGQHAPAIAAYSRAIELDPKNANYYRQRADLYTFRKQYTEALADLTAGIPFDSGVTLLLDRAQLYRQLGKADLAKADGDAALAKSPKEARAWVERGVQADNGRRFDEAVEAFSKALEFEPRNWIALYNRGRIQSNHGKLAEGRRDLEKALEYHPTHLGIRINLAEIKEAAGDLEGGIAERREVVRRSPKSATHRVDLAERLRRANRFPDAIAELDEALRIDPNSADAYSVRAMTRTENQELAAAEADALKALQLSPKMALAMRSLGFIRLQQNRLDECIDLMTQAIALEPSSPRAYDVRAVAHRRAGNLAAAQADEAKVKELLAKPKR
jgi:tetratricopeptide (TPR) repeat protein